MIADKLENAPLYYGIDPNLTAALKYLAEHASELTGKRNMIRLSPDITVKVNEYETVPGPRKWESHLENTDLQYVVSGEECFGIAADNQAHDPVRSEGKDQIVWQAEGSRYYLPEGYFHIFFPGEVHMTKLNPEDKPVKVCKVVFKVKMKNRKEE